MNQEPDFSLPSREQQRNVQYPSRWLMIFAGAAFVAVLVNIGLTLLQQGGTGGREAAFLSPAAQKELAFKLEKQDLAASAAEAWKDYLAMANATRPERARVWYRIGVLHQQAGDYEKALGAFYRSEGASLVEEIKQDIARRVQECLGALGRFSALRREIEERVAVDTNAVPDGGTIVAELGAEKISMADLERRIEEMIGHQTDRIPDVSAEERRAQKEAALRHFSTPDQKLRMLNQLVMEEVLYRWAREEKIADDPEMRSILMDMERTILAQEVMRKEVEDKVRITPLDEETWYKAHKSEYMVPERLKIAHILVKDEEAAKAVLARIEKGEKFEDLAAELSLDKATAGTGGASEEWAMKGEPELPLIGASREGAETIFKTAAGQVCEKAIETDAGCHVLKVLEREAEKQLEFQTARKDVRSTLFSRKQAEAQETLLDELKRKYNAVIHQSAFGK